MKKLLKKIKAIWTNNYFNKKRLEKSKKILRKKYNNKNNITIFSPNCIAGEIYNLLGLKFCSPLINTSLDRNDFVTFLENMDIYLNSVPVIRKNNDGSCFMSLGDNSVEKIIIQFPHDYDIDEVLQKWERRKKRIDKNNIYIICDDRGISKEKLDKINSLTVKKIIIFSSKELGIKNNFVVKIYKNKNCVGKYNVKGLDGLYVFQHFFDCADFLNDK